MTKEYKNMWVVCRDDNYIADTFSYYKKYSIGKFIEGRSHDWSYWYKKHGYRCIKVNITINEVTP